MIGEMMTTIERMIHDLAYEGDILEVIVSGVKYKLQWINSKYMVVRDCVSKKDLKKD